MVIDEIKVVVSKIYKTYVKICKTFVVANFKIIFSDIHPVRTQQS